METYPPTSAIVLAGGQSRRLGHDKRRLRLWGETGPMLLEQVVNLLGQVCDEVIAVLNDAPDWASLPARLVPDAFADGGSLGGIYSGLRAAQYSYALVVACDMPFLNLDLLRAMLARPRDYDVLVPQALEAGATRNQLGLETLHAIYGQGCLAPMRATLDQGRRQIAAFFPQVRVATLAPDDVRRYDPQGRSFLNVNTPEQAAEATSWLERGA